MKLATRILSLLVMIGLATFYISCDSGGGDDKSQEEKQLIAMSGSWALQSANDGADRTAGFPNLVLTLSGPFSKNGTYNYEFKGTRPNPSPWPQKGTWKFGTNVLTQAIRDPETVNTIDVTYSVSGSTLTMSFNVPDGSTGWAGGTSRVKSVTGDWTFVFTKQ
jgi:hypothetical protein